MEDRSWHILSEHRTIRYEILLASWKSKRQHPFTQISLFKPFLMQFWALGGNFGCSWFNWEMEFIIKTWFGSHCYSSKWLYEKNLGVFTSRNSPPLKKAFEWGNVQVWSKRHRSPFQDYLPWVLWNGNRLWCYRSCRCFSWLLATSRACLAVCLLPKMCMSQLRWNKQFSPYQEEVSRQILL